MPKARGFILQATYRVTSTADGRRLPVVHLYGRLEGGVTFLVRDDRQRPHFYVRAGDLSRATALQGVCRRPSRSTSTLSPASPCAASTSTSPRTCRRLRDRLHAAGIDTFEADVRFASRYLIERGIKGGCEIEGDSTSGRRRHSCSTIRMLRPGRGAASTPRVLSFDIETDAKAERLLAISLYGPGSR